MNGWWELAAASWMIAFVVMLVLWLVQVAKRDAAVVDVGWCTGIGLTLLYYAFHTEGYPARRWLVTFLGCFWAFRISLYILLNRVIGREEDGRYRRLREYFGERANAWFFLFFESQTLLVVLFSLPFLPLLENTTPYFSVWEWLGIGVWIASNVGESIADRQLTVFRADPANRGKTCRAGLWRYSRHPNYFFEFLHWWAYVLMAIGVPWGWLTLVGPPLMLFFLLKITGIPHTEIQSLSHRPDYADYQRTTSAFIPWFPKS